jgi:hypothetical protein
LSSNKSYTPTLEIPNFENLLFSITPFGYYNNRFSAHYRKFDIRLGQLLHSICSFYCAPCHHNVHVQCNEFRGECPQVLNSQWGYGGYLDDRLKCKTMVAMATGSPKHNLKSSVRKVDRLCSPRRWSALAWDRNWAAEGLTRSLQVAPERCSGPEACAAGVSHGGLVATLQEQTNTVDLWVRYVFQIQSTFITFPERNQEILGRTDRLLAFHTIRTAWKTCPAILLLHVYFLPRECVYRAVA